MLPDLVSLRLFLRAVERSSLSRAARDYHIALAAASRRISLLEHCYGLQLLYRSAQGVEPTPAGTSLAYHARKILDCELLLRSEMSDFLKGVKGHIRLQVNTSAITQCLPKELAEFSALYPDVKIELSESRSSSIVQALRDSKADVGIVMARVSTEGLKKYSYYQDQLSAIVPLNHELKTEKTSFSEIIKFDLVGLDGDTAMMHLLFDAANELAEPLRLRIQVSSFEAVCQFVQAGMGIGILPIQIAERFGRAMDLRVIELEDDWASRDMFVCIRDIKTLSTTTRNLVEHLIGVKDLKKAPDISD
ncbi:LysR family transcriptional regulator [Marinobacterium rhizophilum]|uniref:LysR family transcriptional regulator n=1 Tax=Marinobacterium rhizophilum TaxID=420402 RepID=UPI00059390BB|nr:LysR family transcriptional regulator [Marinobacterium rhizophilum]